MSSYLLSNQQLILSPQDSMSWLADQLKADQPSNQKLYANQFQEFIDEKLKLPDILKLSDGQYFSRLHDYLIVSIELSSSNLVDNLQKVNQVLKQEPFSYLMFPVQSAKTSQDNIEFLLTIPTNKLITKPQHDWYVENILLTQLEPALNEQIKQIFINPTSQFNKVIQADPVTDQTLVLNTLSRHKFYMIDTEILKKQELLPNQKPSKKDKKKADKPVVQYSTHKLEQRLADFLKEVRTKEILKDQKQLHEMMLALASDRWRENYPKDFYREVIDGLSTLKIIDRNQLMLKYLSCYAELQNNSQDRLSSKTFGEYLQIYKNEADPKINTLAKLMVSEFDSNFTPSSDLDLNVAIEKIAESFPPALLDQPGKDKDNVVIFDPLSGIWRHDEDEFYALLTAVRSSSKAIDLDTMLRTLGAQARNRNAFIKPYDRSAHYVFLNCVVERRTKKTYALNDNYVRDLHFTERSRLHINYDPSVTKPPKIKNDLVFGGDWDPENFISAYAGNDPEKTKFLYFLLSLGLFGGHNTRMNVSFQGGSGWGKTTLLEIFRALYNNHVFSAPLPQINDQFGLTSYSPMNSVVWFNECNTGIDPLNDAYGINRYDGFSDNQLTMQIKHNPDYVLENPPQTYVDGTAFLPVKELSTGPGRRTIVYKFPSTNDNLTKEDIQKLRNQSYAAHINDDLHNEKVLQYLVNQMMNAFDTQMNISDDRLDSLEINITGPKNDLQYFPAVEKQWRKEMISAQDDLGTWFKDEFEPYLQQTNDPKEATMMHDNLAYLFYQKSYQVRNEATDRYMNHIIGLERFARQFHVLLENNGWEHSLERDDHNNPKRRVISNLSRVNFNFEKFKRDGNSYPDSLDLNKHKTLPYPFGKRVRNWYSITRS